MFKNLKRLAAVITFLVILTSISLAGCSSNMSQTPSSSSGQQSTNQPAQQQQSSSSGEKPAGSPGQPPQGASNMEAILNRAAEILGISADKFTAAFQNAMPQPGSGQEGQPSQPPSGEQGQPPEPPSGQQGQPSEPPSGQQMSQSQFMTETYAKMAVELNISADDIAKAMAQAEEELKK